MTNVLMITAIGMGLVFVVILLLWAMMELLVRLTAEKPKIAAETPPALPDLPVFPIESLIRAKRKTAAVAVAAAIQIRRRQAAVQAVRQALASQKQNAAVSAAPLGAHPNTALPVSNWQAVNRAAQRQERQKLFDRTPKANGKPRGES